MNERQSHGPMTTTDAGIQLAGQKRWWTVGPDGQRSEVRNDHQFGSPVMGTS
jgi:hypothetical protein